MEMVSDVCDTEPLIDNCNQTPVRIISSLFSVLSVSPW